MKEGPILMNGAMVRATLAGDKTNTRRTQGLEFFSDNDAGNWRCVRVSGGNAYFVYGNSPKEHVEKCPYGQPGDRLWVRETCRAEELDDGSDGVRYAADDAFIHIRAGAAEAEAWHKLFNYRGQQGAVVPSIHMPRWASRILLEITSVRVERLWNISEQDALAEGIEKNWTGDPSKGQNGFGTVGWVPDCGWINYMEDMDGEPAYTPQDSFRSLWQSINGRDSWAANPWVWVVEFRRI
ncbi:hypothetical protein EJD96_00260 (plasmid) [Herbaspirillum seropedicae]|uniref:hypothetical protein n=1 Tax=Herbaspirillum seropedicae TaxID=964 RepID=UPI001121B06E|nr:hypothetical protein [Herbaspirillum seropedicae]QDD62682.1 hypothetical protein EJD96_00260 [Herbaspirillum seropedicae]